jgi:pyridine nucleotide-disulfide oxidoreductase family protein
VARARGSGPRPRLVLAGCGHSHLFVLEALAAGRFGEVDATLVSPDEEYFYSGMIPGVVAQCYRPEEARFRPAHLARAAGAAWVRAAVTRVDPRRRRVELDSGESLPFDRLSLDVGARLAGDDLPGVGEHAIPVKPMRRALAVLDAAEREVERAGAHGRARVVVVGGGAAGVEMGICLDARLAARFGRGRHEIVLLEAGDRILTEHPARFRTLAAAVMGGRGITVRTGVRVEEVRAGHLRCSGRATVPFDLLLWATGPRAPSLPRESALPVDERGYLRVAATLQCASHPHIFGAGDCAVLEGAPWVPRAGVYAVREGPVLADNLARSLRGAELREYHPQREWLSLMNTGDRHSLLRYRGRVHRSRPAWWLKDWIDRRFMRRFQRLESGG